MTVRELYEKAKADGMLDAPLLCWEQDRAGWFELRNAKTTTASDRQHERDTPPAGKG